MFTISEVSECFERANLKKINNHQTQEKKQQSVEAGILDYLNQMQIKNKSKRQSKRRHRRQ